MKVKLILKMAAVVCIASTAALAGGWLGDHDMDGMYTGAHFGQGWASDFRMNYEIANNGAGEAGIVYKTRSGARGGVDLGYKYGNFRFDLEVSYLTNNVDNIVYLNASQRNSTGRVIATSYLGNIYYDFNQGSKVVPYLGLGAGATNVRGRTVSSVNSPDMLGSKTASSYQAIAGLGYLFTHSTQGSIDYRYLETKTARWKAYHTNQGQFASNAKGRYKNGSVNLGITYFFG